MVVDLFLGVLKSVLTFTLGLLPHVAVPEWLTSAVGTFNGLVAGLAGTQGWLPWDVLSFAIALALAAAVASVAVRGFRIVLSFLTLGGGGA